MSVIRQETLNECTRAEQSASVVLWEIDLTEVGGERYFFCNEQNEKGEPVTWQGRQYQPYPIQGSGFELNGKGTSTRPTLTVSNLYGIGAGIENTPDGMQSQVLLAADRIAMINPANGNTKPMFVGQGDQIFMNEVFLKRLTAPTITSGGNPPAFSLTSDGRLTAKNADISGSVNANSGTLNNVTINQNCTIKGMLEATQVRGDFVKAVSKAFPKKVGTWGNTETPNGTVTVTISDDHNFDRQIIIPPIIFNGIAYDDPGSGNNPGGTRYTGYGFEVRKNGVLIASRETKGAIPGSYSAVIDMPSGRGSVTLEFKIFQKGNQGAGNITDCTVIVTKKAASGISIR
ncbi:phage minor tail protein L [Escherichia coli STEC_S1191]|nr:phage minor tail protein L [Escherichia coli STEC_S1191]